MGEYPQGVHNTFANHPSPTGLKTAENRCRECFCTVDTILTKVIQVQRLHMNLIGDFVAISDYGNRRDLVEKQKKECEHLEEEMKFLKKNMLERVLGSERDELNVLTLPRCSRENIGSSTLECDLRSNVKRENGVKSIDENEYNVNQIVDLPIGEDEEKDKKFVCTSEPVGGPEQNSRNVVFVDTDSPAMSVGFSTSKCDPWVEVKHESDVELIDEKSPFETLYQSEIGDFNILEAAVKTKNCAGPRSTLIRQPPADNEKLRPSNECEKSSKSVKHTRSPSAKKSHSCKMCGKEFTHKIHLGTHMRWHSGEKPYECNICAKKFGRKPHLIEHLRIHNGEICEKKFCNNSRLASHMRVHNSEKPYECEMCVKKFSHQASLNRHIRAHDGEKPFKCKVCGRRFRIKAHLVRHLRIHNGSRPYECKICCRKFAESGTLKRHLRTHTGEKPYECKVCSNKFRATWTLKLHMRLHEGKISYEC